jgi:transposase
MPSNNSKYSEEMRTQTAEHILRSGKSATSVAEELGIDTNTVCRWVRDYRRAKGLPSYSEGKESPKSNIVSRDMSQKVKKLEQELKKREKELKDEQEKVDILKKSLHIFMQPRG